MGVGGLYGYTVPAWPLVTTAGSANRRPIARSAGPNSTDAEDAAWRSAGHKRFTLATDIDVLPMTIYTEFTLGANMVTAAGLSIILGIVTWAVLAAARSATGPAVAATA